MDAAEVELYEQRHPPSNRIMQAARNNPIALIEWAEYLFKAFTSLGDLSGLVFLHNTSTK